MHATPPATHSGADACGLTHRASAPAGWLHSGSKVAQTLRTQAEPDPQTAKASAKRTAAAPRLVLK